jgi:energy-converting hydrogenase A subunit R
VSRIFITDCEGPISKNDNAFELSERLIPDGARLFSLISKYDDIQVEIVRRQHYEPGDTLRLILPFLKAYGATDALFRSISEETLRLVPGARETLGLVSKVMPSFIVSTSYEHYIESLCQLIGFPKSNTYSTKLDLDSFKIPDWEIERVKMWADKLAKLSPPRIPPKARSIQDFDKQDRESIEFLDQIIWHEILGMTIGRIITIVKPVGGAEKVEAVKDILRRHNSDLKQTVYFGDSITDSEPLKYVREGEGLAVSFNGNEYAIRQAELAILSGDTLVTTIIALIFNKGGKEAVRQLVASWDYDQIEKTLGTQLRVKAEEVYHAGLPQVEIVTENNIERLTKESCLFRKQVRGEAIGSLG